MGPYQFKAANSLVLENEKEISFKSGAYDIYARLVMPSNSKDKHAGCVFVPGWGGQCLETSLIIARDLSKEGVTSLLFDPSNSGQSYSRDPNQKSLNHADVVAHTQEFNEAVTLLAENQYVDASRIRAYASSYGCAIVLNTLPSLDVKLDKIVLANPVPNLRESLHTYVDSNERYQKTKQRWLYALAGIAAKNTDDSILGPAARFFVKHRKELVILSEYGVEPIHLGNGPEELYFFMNNAPLPVDQYGIIKRINLFDILKRTAASLSDSKVMVIGGENDHLTSRIDFNRLADMLNATKVELKGKGHVIYHDGIPNNVDGQAKQEISDFLS